MRKVKEWKIPGFGRFSRTDVKLRGTAEAVVTMRFEPSSGNSRNEDELTALFTKAIEGFPTLIEYHRVSAQQLYFTVVTAGADAAKAQEFAREVVNDVVTAVVNLLYYPETEAKPRRSRPSAPTNKRPRTIRRAPHQLAKH